MKNFNIYPSSTVKWFFFEKELFLKKASIAFYTSTDSIRYFFCAYVALQTDGSDVTRQ